MTIFADLGYRLILCGRTSRTDSHSIEPRLKGLRINLIEATSTTTTTLTFGIICLPYRTAGTTTADKEQPKGCFFR